YCRHPPELRLLLRGRERVARLAGGESALRAQGQALQRDLTRRLADARLHERRVLELTLLGGQEPEHHGGLRPHVAERPEIARARGVVLEQEAVVAAEAREDLRADP